MRTGALPPSADVVVIGGGCIGTSVAYHLARLGCTRVLLLERDSIACGSTGHAAGLVHRQFRTEVHVRLAIESVRFFERLAAEKEFGVRFHQNGYLHLLFSEQELAAARAAEALWRSQGLDAKVVGPQELLRLLPGLNARDVRGATYCPSDGFLDPYLATRAMATLATRAGATLLQRVPAVGMRVDGGRVVSVRTAAGEVKTPAVVDAAGPWAAKVARMAGVALPVRPFRRQLWFFKPAMLPSPEPPVLFDTAHDFYFRREGETVLLCLGNPSERPSFTTRVDHSFAARVAEYAAHRYPPFLQAGLVSAWAAPRDITPDHEPVLGVVPEVEGFVAAAGHSGHGFMLSPAVGRVLAEYILLGQCSPGIGAFSVARFSPQGLRRAKYTAVGT